VSSVTPATGRPTEILLADDSDVGRYVIATTLRRAGFSVREVPDGIEALREVTANPPDLAILDVKMPGLNGMEVCSRLKADPRTSFVPVLLLSATFLDSSARVEGLDLGADGYLTQPVEAPVLIASVRSLLRTRAAERAERRVSTEWQVTFDAIGDAVALIDQDGRVLRCNLALAEIVGSSPEQMTNALVSELVSGLSDLEARDRSTNFPVSVGDRDYSCRVDDVPSTDSESHAVLILRDVTAERELGRERERILRRERLISRTLQEALVPGRLPAIAGLKLSSKYLLGESGVLVGGDWFDVIPTPNGVWLTVGDNAGHGVVAAARAVQLRNNLRLLADEGYPPAEAMTRLSSVLQAAREWEIASAMIIALEHPLTAGTIVCAGHPPALLVRPSDGRVHALEEATGPVLGMPHVEYAAADVTLEQGDALVLYTDGLIERRGETIDAGIERLRSVIAEVPVSAMAEHAFSALLPEIPSDDAAIIVAELCRP
jgi:DNA-binding response OmpR family regulator